VDFVEQEFRKLGFETTRNRPYAGGYITEHYGAPASDLHALQIEINRGLYMDEQKHLKRPDFEAFSERMATIVERIARAPLSSFGALRTAAE
jgi:N-formylglutamate amidohydrolase